MSKLTVRLPAQDRDYVAQVLYAMHFCDPSIVGFGIRDGAVEATCAAGADTAAVTEKIGRLLARYAEARQLFEIKTLWDIGTPAAPLDECYDELVRRGWVAPVGRGRVILRDTAAQLLEFLDHLFVARVADVLEARHETYPGCIACVDLAHTQHISSFPQHLFFVTHLREDLDAIDDLSDRVKQDEGWSERTAEAALSHSVVLAVMLNPSCCYHCYVGLRGTDLGDENYLATARTRCHRYEAGDAIPLRRLADFNMREVIFVGHPDWVKQQRERCEALMRELLAELGLHAAFVTANDPFFTNDYKVKAVFQRTQDAKRELVVAMPEGDRMAVASSNFHSTTFGKAFNIRRKRRPACSGCYAWGLERWVYAWFLQHGLEPGDWPAAARRLWSDWRRTPADDTVLAGTR